MTVQTLAEIWAGLEPIVAADAAPAERELLRQSFLLGAFSLLGLLTKAVKTDDVHAVMATLDRVKAELRREVRLKPT